MAEILSSGAGDTSSAAKTLSSAVEILSFAANDTSPAAKMTDR